MLTAQLPAMLVVVGTLLMAVVIFAPGHVALPLVSFAPPVVHAGDTIVREAPSLPVACAGIDVAPWTALVDPSAAACDAAVRLAIVDALAAVRGAWARDLLRRALVDDPSADVRAAAANALAGA